MSDQHCGCASPALEIRAPEISPAPGPEEPSSQSILFDDLALTVNLVTDSEIFPVGRANRARVSGVVVNRSAAATVSFTVLVSNNDETWTSVGSFNVTTVGAFSSSAFTVNAKSVKVRATTASAATVVLWAVLELMFA
ncbi:MAG: hypothetical protein FD180_2808 [Planctomycetota bacterium]|nr:MAG: hypothetical protein FD180_2808 [Planctomycetota bacterium]